MHYKIYTDGGSRGNPGISGAGGLVLDPEGRNILEISEYLGIQTNNYAEYSAVIIILQRIIDTHMNVNNSFEVCMDSLLVVKQINGEWKVKHKNIIPLFNKLKEIISHFENITFTHVYRSLNTRADLLANKAMDSR